MRRSRSTVVILTAMALSLCFITVPAGALDKKVVKIAGGGALSNASQNYADSYMKEAGNCSITVTGSNTDVGFKKLFDGEADMVLATRKITAEEAKTAEQKGISLASKEIGKVELAVITNGKNTVNELTMEQLAKIFKGEFTNWNQVGGPNQPIKVTAMAQTESGVYFQEVVLGGAPFAKDHLVVSSYNTALQVCEKSFAIGYMPTTTTFFDKIEDRGVKVLDLKKRPDSEPFPLASGVTRETFYPISVAFILYWNSKSDNPCIKGFADFVEKQIP